MKDNPGKDMGKRKGKGIVVDKTTRDEHLDTQLHSQCNTTCM